MECEPEPESSLPPKKKSRRDCHFDPKWIKEFAGVSRSIKGEIDSGKLL